MFRFIAKNTGLLHRFIAASAGILQPVQVYCRQQFYIREHKFIADRHLSEEYKPNTRQDNTSAWSVLECDDLLERVMPPRGEVGAWRFYLHGWEALKCHLILEDEGRAGELR